jgi:predicted nuclease with TOPRIM domain
VTSREDPAASEDAVDTAYLNRTSQLHEARAALGEAVHAMRLELLARREEAEALGKDNESLRARYEALDKEWKELGAEVEWQREERARLITETEQLREQVDRLQHELDAAGELNRTYRNMRAVRWTAWPRRIAYRLRGRGA